MDKANMMVKAIHEFVYNLHERGVLVEKCVVDEESLDDFVRHMSVGFLMSLIKDHPGDWLTAMAAVRMRGNYYESE